MITPATGVVIHDETTQLAEGPMMETRTRWGSNNAAAKQSIRTAGYAIGQHMHQAPGGNINGSQYLQPQPISKLLE